MARKQSTKRKNSSKKSNSEEQRSGGRSRSSPSRRSSRSASASSDSSQATTDHDRIRHWTEERGGMPARVQGTGSSGDRGMIRIEFPSTPNSRDEHFQEISWDDFFEKFDDERLALIYRDKATRGGQSNFYKLVKRDTPRRASASG